ncbi:MAG TPA: hypothetical protein VIM73_18105 [Polyangiaceae bacterium]
MRDVPETFKRPVEKIGMSRLITVGLILPLVGCAGRGAERAVSAPLSTRAPITVPATVITPVDATTVPEIYARASKLFDDAAYSRAAQQFDRVATLEPNGDLADDATFRAAEAYDLASEFETAALRYEHVSQRYPASPLATLARIRATRIHVHLDRFQRAGELASSVLASGISLNAFDRVLVYAASALARLDENDEVAAATFIEKGRETIEAHRLDAAGRVGKELAALYYALGELRRRRAERILFDPVPPDYLDALERRCQLILDAQSAYSDTMRAYDAHWSAMAGYRIGELYRRLHEDIMKVKPPPSADTEEERQLFEAGMRHRFAILLEKALANVDLTLGMLQRTGEKSSFADRLARARIEIVAARDREQAALARLPYSRGTLEAAMKQVAQRAEEQRRQGGRNTPPSSSPRPDPAGPKQP